MFVADFMKRIVVLLLPLLLLAGCLEKRIDASSKEAYETSLKEVKKELTKEELESFENALQIIAMSNVQGVGDILLMLGKPENYENFLMKRVDGKTAKEVIKEADEIIKAKGKNNQKSDTQ